MDKNYEWIKRVYFISLVLMPLSYGMKEIMALNFIWINPILILNFFIFVLIMPSIKPKFSFLIILYFFINSTLGYFVGLANGREIESFYNVYRESIRLFLNMVFFWNSIYFIKKSRMEVLRWLSIGTIIQFCIAVILWLGSMRLLTLPGTLGEYSSAYLFRQAIWIGCLPIARLGGTFSESPPFGLYMICTFLVLFQSILNSGSKSRVIKTGCVISFLGTVLSAADQVLIGLLLFITLSNIRFLCKKRKIVFSIIIVVLISCTLVPYIANRLSLKIQESSLSSGEIYGSSFGERFFHVKYALELIADNPLLVLFGIGPGRYGDYATLTGLFPNTVTPQVTIIEWLIELGVIGTLFMFLFMFSICCSSLKFHKWQGVCIFVAILTANMLQANWKWEAWFFGLAYLNTNNSGSFLPFKNNLGQEMVKGEG